MRRLSIRVARAVEAEGEPDGDGHGRQDHVAHEHRAPPRAGARVDLQRAERVDLREAAEGERRVAILDRAREVPVVAPPIAGEQAHLAA